jgi:hypothetical protein
LRNISRRQVSIGTLGPTQPGVEVRPERLEERLVIKPGIHPLQLDQQPQAYLRQHRVPQRRLQIARAQHADNPLHHSDFGHHLAQRPTVTDNTPMIVDLLLQAEVV